jgi:hypothetical protein
VVWYDLSELAVRPDKSGNAVLLYDRMEIDGDALRRETGFSDEDKPEGEELKEQALKRIIQALPSGAGSALSELIGEQVVITPVRAAEAGPAPDPGESSPQQDERTEPDTREDEPPEPDMSVRRTERLMAQSRAPHLIRFSVSGTDVLHPPLCDAHAYSCPYTKGALIMGRSVRPGRSGTYECSLDAFGTLRVGGMAPMRSTVDLLVTGGLNGHRR